jgi:hypothetical protein
MSDDEARMTKIDVIRGAEVLGYEGAGREEHSGENSPEEAPDQKSELADNRPEQVK